MIRQLRLGLLVLAALPAVLSAQLNYGYTTFIHGFNDDSARFTDPNTAGLLSSQINLKTREFPNLGGRLKIVDQAANLYAYVAAHPNGPHVLVGHSMGGLTSRSAYFSHPGGTFAAIITLGTPHQGALIADNATRVTGYIANEVYDFFQSVINIMYRPTPGNILSSAGVGYIQELLHLVLEGKLQTYLNAQFGTQTDGLNDIKTTSQTIGVLRSSNDPLPHANVLGTIGRRNAVFRIAYSWAYRDGDFDSFVHKKNRVKSVVKACRQIGWNFIIRTHVGRICNQVDNALGSIDDRWAFWTMGAAEKRDPNATFDGLISTTESRYPGTSLSDPMNFHAVAVDHMNLQYNPTGIGAIVQAMHLVGMGDPPPPPPPPGTIGSVTIYGSSQVEAGCTGGWSASPYGGVAPYTYVWTAEGGTYDTGSSEVFSYAPANSFMLQVRVTDSQGSTGTAYQSVSVVSGNCT
jgi:pimeloyl-ACP methyl ester carboxylesterase